MRRLIWIFAGRICRRYVFWFCGSYVYLLVCFRYWKWNKSVSLTYRTYNRLQWEDFTSSGHFHSVLVSHHPSGYRVWFVVKLQFVASLRIIIFLTIVIGYASVVSSRKIYPYNNCNVRINYMKKTVMSASGYWCHALVSTCISKAVQ